MEVRNVKLTLEHAHTVAILPNVQAHMVKVTVTADVRVTPDDGRVLLMIDLFGDDTGEATTNDPHRTSIAGPSLIANTVGTLRIEHLVPRSALQEDPGMWEEAKLVIKKGPFPGQIIHTMRADDEFRARVLLSDGFGAFQNTAVGWSDAVTAPSENPTLS